MAAVMIKKSKIWIVGAAVVAVLLAMVGVRAYFVFFQPYTYQYAGICVSSRPGYYISEVRDNGEVIYGVVKFSSQRGVIDIGEDFDRIHYEKYHFHKIVNLRNTSPPIHVLAGSESELEAIISMVSSCGAQQ